MNMKMNMIFKDYITVEIKSIENKMLNLYSNQQKT